jgi:hypothetical protein
MRFLVLFLFLLIPNLSLAEDGPTKERAALDDVFRARLVLCREQGEAVARTGYNCPSTAKTVDECTKTGELSADHALSQCVASKLTKDEQVPWQRSTLNPTVPLTKEAGKQ